MSYNYDKGNPKRRALVGASIISGKYGNVSTETVCLSCKSKSEISSRRRVLAVGRQPLTSDLVVLSYCHVIKR